MYIYIYVSIFIYIYIYICLSMQVGGVFRYHVYSHLCKN